MKIHVHLHLAELLLELQEF